MVLTTPECRYIRSDRESIRIVFVAVILMTLERIIKPQYLALHLGDILNQKKCWFDSQNGTDTLSHPPPLTYKILL